MFIGAVCGLSCPVFTLKTMISDDKVMTTGVNVYVFLSGDLAVFGQWFGRRGQVKVCFMRWLSQGVLCRWAADEQTAHAALCWALYAWGGFKLGRAASSKTKRSLGKTRSQQTTFNAGRCLRHRTGVLLSKPPSLQPFDGAVSSIFQYFLI